MLSKKNATKSYDEIIKDLNEMSKLLKESQDQYDKLLTLVSNIEKNIPNLPIEVMNDTGPPGHGYVGFRVYFDSIKERIKSIRNWAGLSDVRYFRGDDSSQRKNLLIEIDGALFRLNRTTPNTWKSVA